MPDWWYHVFMRPTPRSGIILEFGIMLALNTTHRMWRIFKYAKALFVQEWNDKYCHAFISLMFLLLRTLSCWAEQYFQYFGARDDSFRSIFKSTVKSTSFLFITHCLFSNLSYASLPKVWWNWMICSILLYMIYLDRMF